MALSISRQMLIIGAVALAGGMLIGGLIGHFATPIPDGVTKEQQNVIDQYSLLTTDQWQQGVDDDVTGWIVNEIKTENIEEHLRFLSREPHIAGSARDVVLADYILEKFQEAGCDWAQKMPYELYLSKPDDVNKNQVFIKLGINDSTVAASRYREDFGNETLEGFEDFVDAFNAFTPQGDVKSEIGEGVVYVNYGRREDFEYLRDTALVNMTGCIALMRYGAIYRGNMIQNADDFGAIGAILFSDPKDVAAEGVDDVYPGSWWLPGTGMQRGSAYLGDGDPLTPGWPSTEHAHRIDPANAGFVKIPAQPIGYDDAKKIFEMLGGDEAPADWQGGIEGLPSPYNLGPTFQTNFADKYVQLVTFNKEEITQSYNVFGTMTGAVEPDRYVLLGNHRDAWGYGASDPSSGTAQMMETIRVLGDLRKKGWQPRRTLVFCSWGAEEYGLIGSTEWVEEHVDKLQGRAVAYINTDTCSTGPVLEIPASPLLWDMALEITKMVPGVTNSSVTVWDELLKYHQDYNQVEDYPVMTTLGSGSDYAHFFIYAGIPAMDIWFRRDRRQHDISIYPSYHTGFETFEMVSRYNDPGFKFNQGCGRMASLTLKRLADSLILPFALTNFPERMAESLNGFETNGIKEKIVLFYSDYEYLEDAVANLTITTTDFHTSIADPEQFDPMELRRINDQLMNFERSFLIPGGLPGRAVARHAVFAPSQYDNYASAGFPGIVDLMYDYDDLTNDDLTSRQEEIRQHVSLLTIMTNRAAGLLKEVDQFE